MALPSVIKEIFINYWILSKSSLEVIVKASANATRIILKGSKIDCSTDFDFTGPNYCTNYFALPYCGDHQKEGWSDAPVKLERIIKAISCTDIMLSLKTFNVFKCGVQADIVKGLLIKHGMSNVKVEENEICVSSD